MFNLQSLAVALLMGLVLPHIMFPQSSLRMTTSEAKIHANQALAERAFQAWARGEQTGQYTDFKALLGNSFHTFSHPLIGRVTGKEALTKMQELIAGREKVPNRLTFSNIAIATNGSGTVLFQFDSEGTVSGSYPYQGYNIIALTVENGKIIGFGEYFGYVDPQWFR